METPTQSRKDPWVSFLTIRQKELDWRRDAPSSHEHELKHRETQWCGYNTMCCATSICSTEVHDFPSMVREWPYTIGDLLTQQQPTPTAFKIISLLACWVQFTCRTARIQHWQRQKMTHNWKTLYVRVGRKKILHLKDSLSKRSYSEREISLNPGGLFFWGPDDTVTWDETNHELKPKQGNNMHPVFS